MVFDKDRSITIVSLKNDEASDEAFPVFVVDKTTGWKVAGDNLACLDFKALGNKSFTLAFDEIGVYEAVSNFIAAMGVYQNANGPLLAANGLGIDFQGDDVFVRVRLSHGKVISFKFPPESAKSFKDKFKI
jgi:hypothetical protein